MDTIKLRLVYAKVRRFVSAQQRCGRGAFGVCRAKFFELYNCNVQCNVHIAMYSAHECATCTRTVNVGAQRARRCINHLNKREEAEVDER